MIPVDEEERDMLAGEYVLGVLEPEARREVEAALGADAKLRRLVANWEERLAGLATLAPPAEAPHGIWEAIAARIDGPASAKPGPSGAWNSVTLWRWCTVGAAAVAAGLALYIAAAPAVGPRYVAILRAPQQEQPAWVATAGGQGLLVHAVAREAAPDDRAFELWTIPPGSKRPLSLGVIPADGRLALGRLPSGVGAGGTLAISIEPKTGSPTGQPTGPIVFVGTLIAAD